MTINKQYYEDACKLIEQPGAWIRSYNFGLDGQGKAIHAFVKFVPNCWCYNGALIKVIFKDDELIKQWWDTNFDHLPQHTKDLVNIYREHQNAIANAFIKIHDGYSPVYYNDAMAQNASEMANEIRKTVATMEG